MAFDCLGIGDGLYQTMSGDLEVLLAPDSALEILPGGEGVGGLSVVTEQRTVAPVAFAAYSLSSVIQTVTGTEAIAQFAAEEFDLGNDYNTGSYTFTAPIDGLYFFSLKGFFDALGTGSSETATVKLKKNGGSNVRAGRVTNASADSTSDQEASLADLLVLNAGDTIQPYVQTAVSNALLGGGVTESIFSGTLIKAL